MALTDSSQTNPEPVRGSICRLDYPKSEISLVVHSELEAYNRSASCSREPATIEWIESFQDSSVFFDVGANVGAYSLVAAAQQQVRGASITTVCFEPHFANFGSLLKNIALNNFTESILPIHCAVGASTGIGTMYHSDAYSKGESGSSGHQLNRQLDYTGTPFEPILEQKIQMFSLDDFCRINALYPTYLKIDVDGIEEDILKGAHEVLRSGACREVMVEVNPDQQHLVALLEEYGYTVVRVAEHNDHFFRLAQ